MNPNAPFRHNAAPTINPSIHQSTNPPIHQSTNPSIHQSINPPIHQSINPPIHQSTNPSPYPKVAPLATNFPRRRLPDPLPIKTLLEFPVPTSEFGLKPLFGTFPGDGSPWFLRSFVVPTRPWPLPGAAIDLLNLLSSAGGVC
jgi:hypothetical protein